MDHPRSRGVYAAIPGINLDVIGSSPLARGLLELADLSQERGRIIPARAGFTEPGIDGGAEIGDHPRSRGVYFAHLRAQAPDEGSSPLARGLLEGGPPSDGLWRIIPARAGFTTGYVVAQGSGTDHPRSRGVYRDGERGYPAPRGSSPLARGLHMRLEKGTVADRIIPARAGFTWRRGPHWKRAQDHPRSRGVYPDVDVLEETQKGSSPLARGLHPRARRDRSRIRIIPARAGFTVLSTGQVTIDSDHPRSRGVYPSLLSQYCFALGSSPLARGLRNRTMFIEYEQRIIPARAGFTSCGATAWAARSDHPRSRGVYAWTACGAGRGGGSSPLARGLLQLDADRAPPQRIIPARAGFTPGLV